MNKVINDFILRIKPVVIDSPAIVVDDEDGDGEGGGNILPFPEDRCEDGVEESLFVLSNCC